MCISQENPDALGTRAQLGRTWLMLYTGGIKVSSPKPGSLQAALKVAYVLEEKCRVSCWPWVSMLTVQDGADPVCGR